MKIVFEVTGAQWNEYGAGQHEADDPDTVRHAVAAEAAGAGVTVKELDAEAKKLAATVVEPDAKSLKNQKAAIKSGAWQEGNILANGDA